MTSTQYQRQTAQMKQELERMGYRVWHDGKEWHASGPRELVSPFLSRLLEAARQ